MMTQKQVTLQSQSSGLSVSQPNLHREMVERVKEFYGYDDKLSAKNQQDIESDILGSLDKSSRVVLRIRFGCIYTQSVNAVS